MYSPHKHSYLQSVTSNVNPRIINRSVNLARNQPTVDGFDLEPPFNRLTSEQPGIPIKHTDPTRRPCAFGRWAMPKLRRELHHPCDEIVLQAVLTIADLCHDPERGYEAIRLRVPDRMADLLAHSLPAIREATCIALTVMAGLSDGRISIVKNKLSLKNIALLSIDYCDAVRYKAAVLIEMISRTWMAVDYLVAGGYVQLLLKIVLKELDEISIVHLESLKLLMYGKGKDIALDVGGFDIFVEMMEKDNLALKTGAAFCLMMVTSTYAGKELAYNDKTLIKLEILLNYGEREIYTAAAAGIMMCTIKSRAKIRASELMPRLADRLVKLTYDWHYPETQIFTIKALTNICEHPEIKKYVRENHCEYLDGIYVHNNEDIERYKKTLLRVVLWVPWNDETLTCPIKEEPKPVKRNKCHCLINYGGYKDDLMDKYRHMYLDVYQKYTDAI